MSENGEGHTLQSLREPQNNLQSQPAFGLTFLEKVLVRLFTVRFPGRRLQDFGGWGSGLQTLEDPKPEL